MTGRQSQPMRRLTHKLTLSYGKFPTKQHTGWRVFKRSPHSAFILSKRATPRPQEIGGDMPTTTETKTAEHVPATPAPKNGARVPAERRPGLSAEAVTQTTDLASELLATGKTVTVELLAAGKDVAAEVIEAADAIATGAFDEAEETLKDLGAFVPWANAQLRVARTSWNAGTASARRVLELV